MNKNVFIGLFIFLLGNTFAFSQEKTATVLTAKDTVKSNDIDPLTPAKAAFYSAILQDWVKLTIRNIGKSPLFTEQLV